MSKRKQNFKELKESLTLDEWNNFKVYRRRTGNTTGHLLELIGRAMKHADQEFKITDHMPGYTDNEVVNSHSRIKMHVLPTLKELIQKLELEDLEINETKLTLKYNLDWLY